MSSFRSSLKSDLFQQSYSVCVCVYVWDLVVGRTVFFSLLSLNILIKKATKFVSYNGHCAPKEKWHRKEHIIMMMIIIQSVQIASLVLRLFLLKRNAYYPTAAWNLCLMIRTDHRNRKSLQTLKSLWKVWNTEPTTQCRGIMARLERPPQEEGRESMPSTTQGRERTFVMNRPDYSK